ncbi:hypothetical protein BKA70DRAFT_1571574 [Coprinopsis sp. MPI-PUGE-AT-0042]|nr:hypothetical protein BKA70DRAFT_1571574 [Coprinopsis sp. MPI-PUGE-AT-0042]
MAHYFNRPAFSCAAPSAASAWSSASENERSRNEPSALRVPHRLPRLEEGSDEQHSKPLATLFSPKLVTRVSVRESSSGGNTPMLGRITPFFKSGNKELKAHTLLIQKLSGKRVAVSVDEMTSIMDIQRCLWDRLGIHPDQQRLTWQEKPVEHGRRIGELGLKQRATLQLTRTLPGAYVLALSSWGGQIPGHECDLPYLTIGKGLILVAHKLAHADWIFCSDSRGDKGLVPRSHVMVTEIFQKAFYDELKHTCSDNSILPEISQPPDATRKLAAVNVTHSNHLLWRRPIGWLKRLFIAKGAVDSPENPMPHREKPGLQG